MKKSQKKSKKCRVCNFSKKNNKEIKLFFMNNYFICKKCGAYNQSFDKNKSIKNIFIKQQQKYFSEAKIYNSSLMKKIQKEYNINKIKYFLKYRKNGNSSVLEVGPGLGEFSNAVKRFNKDLTVIEESKSYAKYIKKKLNIKVIHNNFLSYNSKKKYDCICSFHVIEHVENVNLFVKKIANFLSRNGMVLIATPNAGAFQHKFAASLSPHFDSAHIHLFKRKTLEKILKDNGFSIIEVVTPQATVFWLRIFSKVIRRIKKVSETDTGGQYVYKDSKIMNMVFIVFKLLTFPFNKIQEVLGHGSEILIVAKKIY